MSLSYVLCNLAVNQSKSIYVTSSFVSLAEVDAFASTAFMRLCFLAPFLGKLVSVPPSNFKASLNTVSSYDPSSYSYMLLKYVKEISPPKGIFVLGGSILLKQLLWNTSILHFNWKSEREFKSDIPNKCTDCIHLTIISIQCCVLVIPVQEIFPKEKPN